MHPSFPFVEALENVPTGHGARRVSYSVLLVGICLNPEANKAEIICCLNEWCVASLTASTSEPREFLEQIKRNYPC